MRAQIDTNIILDALLARQPWAADALEILRAHQDGRVECSLTTHTIATMYYIGEKAVGAAQALADVKTCLSMFEVHDVTRQSLDEAVLLPGQDFEDNIQIAVAVKAGVDFIVTRDRSGFTASPIPSISPADLVARLPPPPP
jgi:predicted nucleic acid-binding protein